MKWKVSLIYKEVIEVDDIEADDKEAAIAAAVNNVEFGHQRDYYWYDAEAEQV